MHCIQLLQLVGMDNMQTTNTIFIIWCKIHLIGFKCANGLIFTWDINWSLLLAPDHDGPHVGPMNLAIRECSGIATQVDSPHKGLDVQSSEVFSKHEKSQTVPMVKRNEFPFHSICFKSVIHIHCHYVTIMWPIINHPECQGIENLKLHM